MMGTLGLRDRDRVKAWVERRMRSRFFDDHPKHPTTTTYGRCLTELAAAALQADPDLDLDPDEYDAEVLSRIVDFVDALAMAMVDRETWRTKPDFWRHLNQPVWEVRHGEPPEIDRADLEGAADQYLELPVRATYVDRLVVDMLIACELVAYAKVVYGKMSSYESALYRPGSFIEYLKGRAKNAAFWVMAYLVAIALPFGWLPDAVVWLAVLDFVISTAILPWALRSVRRHNDKVLRPLKAIMSVYADVASSGSVSARHVRDQATKAVDAGVGWPGPLFVVLDDVLARGGRL